jgi:DNA damage-inducible protein 1
MMDYSQFSLNLQLVDLGFTRDAAIRALTATGGNVEYAAGMLF